MLDLMGCLGLRFCWDIACRADWAIRGFAISFLTSPKMASWNPSCSVCKRMPPLYDCIETELNLFNMVHGGERDSMVAWTQPSGNRTYGPHSPQTGL